MLFTYSMYKCYHKINYLTSIPMTIIEPLL